MSSGIRTVEEVLQDFSVRSPSRTAMSDDESDQDAEEEVEGSVLASPIVQEDGGSEPDYSNDVEQEEGLESESDDQKEASDSDGGAEGLESEGAMSASDTDGSSSLEVLEPKPKRLKQLRRQQSNSGSQLEE